MKKRHKNISFSPSSCFFLPGQKIVILHSFSLKCTSEKLVVLNFGELFRLNDLHLSQMNLAFKSVVSSTAQFIIFYLPAAILLFFQQAVAAEQWL